MSNQLELQTNGAKTSQLNKILEFVSVGVPSGPAPVRSVHRATLVERDVPITLLSSTGADKGVIVMPAEVRKDAASRSEPIIVSANRYSVKANAAAEALLSTGPNPSLGRGAAVPPPLIGLAGQTNPDGSGGSVANLSSTLFCPANFISLLGDGSEVTESQVYGNLRIPVELPMVSPSPMDLWMDASMPCMNGCMRNFVYLIWVIPVAVPAVESRPSIIISYPVSSLDLCQLLSSRSSL